MNRAWRVILTLAVILIMGFAFISSESMYGKLSDDPDSIAYKINKTREGVDNVVSDMFKGISSN